MISLSSCKSKVSYTQYSVSEIRTMIESKNDSLDAVIQGMKLYWFDKQLAVETALYLDTKKNFQFFTSYYGLYLSDSLIASRLIDYLQDQNKTITRFKYPSFADDRSLFQALLKQDPKLTQKFLNESLQQWNDTAKTLLLLTNPSDDLKMFMQFSFDHLLYIRETLLIHQSPINTSIDIKNINSALEKLKGGYESLTLYGVADFPDTGSIIKLKSKCLSLFDLKINKIKQIKSRMAQFEPKHGARFIAIINESKALISLSMDFYSEQYLIELTDSSHIRITCVGKTIS
jgi:hypothetical protein